MNGMFSKGHALLPLLVYTLTLIHINLLHNLVQSSG